MPTSGEKGSVFDSITEEDGFVKTLRNGAEVTHQLLQTEKS